MSEKVKGWIGTTREGLLILLFIILFFFPELVNDRMVKAGFRKGSLAGFDWEAVEKSQQEVKNAAETISQIQQRLDETSTVLTQLQTENQDPASNQKIQELTQDIQASRDNIQEVDDKLKKSYLTQEALIKSNDPVAAPRVGWIFLGRVNSSRTDWVGGRPQTINDVKPANLMNAIVTITDNVYLRDITDDTFKTSAPILTVVKRGEQVTVQDVHYSPAKGGGAFVWIKAERSL